MRSYIIWSSFVALFQSIAISLPLIEATTLNEGVERLDFNMEDMPAWFSEYVRWHSSIRSDPALFAQEKCLIVDRGTGGLADRLKHIPYFIWLAARHHRVLLIDDWGLTCHINEFFQPSLIDWTAPPELRKSAVSLNGPKSDPNEYFFHLVGDEDFEKNKSARILITYGNHQSLIAGLNKVYQESDQNRKIFKYIFHSVLRLSTPVQQMLDGTKRDLGLVDKDYLGFHLRMRYPETSKVLNAHGQEDVFGFQNITPDMTKEMLRVGENALQCVKSSSGQPQITVYGAADTVHALEVLKQNHNEVVYLPSDGERVHTGHNPPQGKCSTFYPALIDLWILSGAKCIAFGHGGYGSLATMMSDFECWSIHQYNNMLCKGNNNLLNFPYFNQPETGKLPECFDASESS